MWMVTHAVLLLIYFMNGCLNVVCILIFLWAFVVVEVISIIFQRFLDHHTRKVRWNPIAKIAAFHAPVLVLFTLSFLPIQGQQKENQRSPVASPNGLYILEVPIENRRWTVKIFDQAHTLLYADADSNFFGRFNSYWAWDKDSRVWLYNSDNGQIFYWESVAGQWKKHPYDTDPTLKPPREMYPKYVLPK